MADYAFGSGNWPGLAKLIEECGEVLEIAGKIMGVGGGPDPIGWDGSSLIESFEEELADLTAAIGFVVDHVGLEGGIRSREKRAQFLEWHIAGDPPPAKTWVLDSLKKKLQEVGAYYFKHPLNEIDFNRFNSELEAVLALYGFSPETFPGSVAVDHTNRRVVVNLEADN